MRLAALAMAALVGLTAGAQAAVSVVSVSALNTGVVGPPVKLELGAAGTTARYFSPFSLSANATTASGTVLGRAGADLYAKDALRVVNTRAADQSVTLNAAQLSNAQLDVFAWYLYNGATLVATLDMEAASPSISFTLPASTTYRLDMRLDLGDGAGNNTAPTAFEVGLRVGSGGIVLTHATSAPALSVHTVVVPLRPLIAGAAVGANSTNGTASVNAPTVLANTQNAFYLNNTAPAASYAKLVLTSSASISDVNTANIGIASGASTDHIKVSGGSIAQTEGSYQILAAGSTNQVYVRSLEGVLFNGATLDFDVYVSDTATGDSYTVSKARITLT